MQALLIVFLVTTAGFAILNRLGNRGIARVDAESARNLIEDAGMLGHDETDTTAKHDGRYGNLVLVFLTPIGSFFV